MEIKIKDSVSCINGKWDEDYTYIFDAESKAHIFISNSLLAGLENKKLEEREKEIFLQIKNTQGCGTYPGEDLKNCFFIRTEEDFEGI